MRGPEANSGRRFYADARFAEFLRRDTDLFESVRDWRLIHICEAPRGDLRAGESHDN
jgi:hypothetical protein